MKNTRQTENCNVYSFPDNRVSYFTFNANSEKMQDIELKKSIYILRWIVQHCIRQQLEMKILL